ncbi:MAG: peptidyl-prolyl cis-trans isomerase [Calditrichaeota bacterium]|nr:MAG: peptidyl-prolyl cis-trans isomerase [Calditrichota bacterium]
MKTKIILIIVAIILVISWLVILEPDKAVKTNPSSYAFDTLKSKGLDKAIVARVGDIEITGEEFFTSYEVGPSFVKRKYRRDPRQAHLRFMIYEKLMALDGLKQGVLERRDLQRILEEIHQDLAVTEMFREDVYDTVNVSQKEIERAVSRATVHVNLKYIFANSQEQIHNYQRQLQQGVSFDSLAIKSGGENSKDWPNFWDIQQIDPEFAQAIANLPFHQISQLIKTRRGYYLARVDTVWRNPFITPPQYNELLAKYRKRLKRKKVDSLAFEYAATRLERAKPVIKRQAFNLLLEYFKNHPRKETESVKEALLGNWPGTLDRHDIEEKQNITLVVSTQGDFTVKDFLDWYTLRRFPLDRHSERGMASSLKSIIWRMVRDRILAREAFQRRYDKHPQVVEELSWWKEKLAYWEVREALLADLNFTEEQIRQFYQKHKERYTKPGEKVPQPFEKVRDDVLRELYTFEESKRLMYYLNKKEQEYPVKIHYKVLEKIPVTDLKLSKPIDLFVFKKGGTFPRIAYPTIDRVWERY